MAEIVIEGLRHAYGGDLSDPGSLALKRIDLTWKNGRAYALLGPSGCGKSTMLNIISGLVRQSEGRLLFDGTDVSDLSPERRNIAQVFQFPVLYDSMTVEQNLAFPLRNRKHEPNYIRRRVNDVAEMLDLGPLLKKRAAGLGAAEKQKISLGRGLVREDVSAILFDEPLTVIDPHEKFELRRKLKILHEALNLTLIYVTHDQSEALTLADEVVVMNHGEVMQVGPPDALYERPAHTFVGDFIGSPGMNFIPCTCKGNRLHFAQTDMPAPGWAATRARNGENLKIGVRPQALRPAGADEAGTPARVIEAQLRGDAWVADIIAGGQRLKMRIPDDTILPEGEFRLHFPAGATLVYADDHLVGGLDE